MREAAHARYGLFRLLEHLEASRIFFTLGRYRDSIMVLVSIPGQRWEVEYFEDGHIEVEKFVSDGALGSAADLDELFDNWTNDSPEH